MTFSTRTASPPLWLAFFPICQASRLRCSVSDSHSELRPPLLRLLPPILGSLTFPCHFLTIPFFLLNFFPLLCSSCEYLSIPKRTGLSSLSLFVSLSFVAQRSLLSSRGTLSLLRLFNSFISPPSLSALLPRRHDSPSMPPSFS